MKYGIHNGYVVKLGRETNNMIAVIDDYDSSFVLKPQVIEIDDNDFKDLEPEFNSVKEEIKKLRERIGKLESEYFKKSNALNIMLMDLRKRELAITTKVLDRANERRMINE